MRTFANVTFMSVVLGVGGWAGSFSSAAGADRSAEQIIEELDDVKIPSYDASKKNDATYARQFPTKLQEATEKRAALILELYKADPDHERISTLMAERWGVRPFGLPANELQSEIDDVLAHTQNQKLKIEGNYSRTYAKLYDSRRDEPLDLSGVAECLKLIPKDPRRATLLRLAANRTYDGKIKTSLEDRVCREFPESAYAQGIQGIRHQSDRIEGTAQVAARICSKGF